MKSYDAFISYTHRSEMDVAVALDDAMTRFAKPWNKLRAKRIYRDTDSQALTPNLLAAVQEAMNRSDFLILLASPESAQSNWVPAETRHWVENRPLDKLLIVVCAGEVAWDDDAGDFDWDRTDCLPRTSPPPWRTFSWRSEWRSTRTEPLPTGSRKPSRKSRESTDCAGSSS